MKFPKERKRLCPFCKKHTVHKIKQEKNRGKNKTHPMTTGSKCRTRARGEWRGAGNKGKYSRGAPNSWKMSGKKRTKHTDLRYTCADCRKTHAQSHGFRAAKMQFE